MANRLRLAAIFASSAAAAALLVGPAGAFAQTSSVQDSIYDFSYNPAGISVPVGATVVWTNKDATTHTVTSDNGTFNSGNIAAGQAYRFTFTKAGTYNYSCDIHDFMHGNIVVTAGPAPSAPAPSAASPGSPVPAPVQAP